jgi:four helix bundle protein
MISKLAIVEEEADECGYWLELLCATGYVSAQDIAPLRREASELTAIMVASKKRLRAKLRSEPRRNSKFEIRNSDES